MKRPSKFDGEGKSLAGDLSSSPSSGPPGSNRLILFPGAAARSPRDTEGADVSSASASSFTLLGDLTHAVVLRLAGGYPKIRGPERREGGVPAAPVVQSAPGEEEER